MNRKLLPMMAGCAVLCACTPTIQTKNEVEIKPIEIKPMSISIDVNVNVKVERELNDIFGDMDKQAEQL